MSRPTSLPSCLSEKLKRNENSRQKERRAADFAIKNGTAVRQKITPETRENMFQQIDANDINGFGIRRLVHMELNDLHPSPPCLAWEPYVTMIGYAAWRKRERIVKGLLRAGADPGVRWCDGKSDYEKLHSGAGTPQVTCQGNAASENVEDPGSKHPVRRQSVAQEALGGAPPAYAVWIVCTLSRMRLAGTLAQQKEQDMRCRPCGHQLQQPVGWPCGHVCCETCFWNGVRFRLRQGEEICCPICKAPSVQEPDESHPVTSTGEQHQSTKKTAPRPPHTRRPQRVPGPELRLKGNPGDWDCQACRYRNFSYRAECRVCQTPPNSAFQVHAEAAEPSTAAWPWHLVSRKPARLMYLWGACAVPLVLGASALCGSKWSSARLPVVSLCAVTAAGAAAWGVHVATQDAPGRDAAACSPQQRKADSLASWLKLPTEAEAALQESAAGGRPRHRSVRFKALPLATAAQMFLGNTREKRTLELYAAAISGNTRRLKALLSAGVDVDASNEYGQTALFMSAQQGHAEAVLLLLSFAASANAAAHGGALPATSAAAQQHEAALRALLDAGADPSLRGSHGQTALEYEGSAGRGCGPVAKLLQSRMGVSPDSFVADSQDSPSARVGTLVPARTVQVLIDPGSTHAGAGSYIVDGALPEEFLIQVEELWRSLPIADKKQAGSDRIIHRSYFCDSEGWLGAAVRHALRGTQCCEVHDCIRFLHYFEPGGQLPPHTDLSKTNAAGQRSTHTLLIYLATCSVGGETVLLESLGPGARVFATVQPRRGRMLIFPHDCPHKAEPVVEVPKVVVRGEAH